jgi:hypothetical protein
VGWTKHRDILVAGRSLCTVRGKPPEKLVRLGTDVGVDIAIVAGGRRLAGRDDSDARMNANEGGVEECSRRIDFRKRSCTRGVTSVDSDC